MTRLAVAALLAVLTALLLWEWLGWERPALPEPSVPAAAMGAGESDSGARLADKLPTIDDRDSYAIVVERPVFRPDRKPEPPEETETAKPSLGEEELAAVDLTAVMITPESVLAWIKRPDQPRLVKLRVGDDLSGWAVQQVLEDRVRLQRQGEKYELVLRDYSKSSPSAAPTPVPRRQAKQPAPASPPPQKQAPMRRRGPVN